MALYHFRAQIFSRGQGRCVIAAAAYRHGASMLDLQTGGRFDYAGREDVAHSEFSVPSDAPAWVRNMADEVGSPVRTSEAFWNRVDELERRSNGQLAREVEFSLPVELTREQNITLAREFVSQTFLQEGMVADWAYHDKEGNPHVHVMLTMRPLTEDGFGRAWKPVLDPDTGEQLRTGSGKLRYEPWSGAQERLIAWRKAWAETQNRHLAMAGVETRVSHESYRAQGIEVEPSRHMGPRASAIHSKGRRTIERDRLSPEAKAHNVRLFSDDPAAVLKIITREKSVFDERDVARTIHRLVDDPAPFEAIRLRVLACPDLVELAPAMRDAETGQELSRARYTTAEMLGIETRMMAGAAALREIKNHGASDRFVAAAIEAKPFLAADQREAIRYVTGPEQAAAVVGFAGAGKSTMLAAAREAWEAAGYRVHGAALAGKAAEGLEQSSGIRSRTLAGWELAWSKDRDRLGSRDVLVIDEAGMVSSRQMERFISAAKNAGAKIVLVGDAAQLQPIEAGAAFRAITEEIGYAELTGVRRQREHWAREASVSFAQGRVGDALDAYASRDLVQFEDTREAARTAALDGWMEDRAQRGSTLILAHTNADVYALNEGARERLKARGELAGEASILTARGTRRFASGDRILFLENDRSLDVKNGMLGTVSQAEPGRLRVELDTESGPARTVEVDQRTYNNVDWGYAATIHKSQGATVDRVRVLASPSMDRHLAYVAMSRHRESAVLHAGRDDFRNIVGLGRKLSRSGAKEVSTDYLKGRAAERFAERRGVTTWREAVPAFLAFARRQAAWVQSARAQLGQLWSRAEAAMAKGSASTKAASSRPAHVEAALRRAATKTASPGTSVQPGSPDKRASAVQHPTAAAKPQAQAKGEPPTHPQRKWATATEFALDRAKQKQTAWEATSRPTPAAQTGGGSPAPGQPVFEDTPREPALVEPLRDFEETASMVAKAAVFGMSNYARREAELAELAGQAFQHPKALIAKIVSALDREPDDFDRHVARLVDEVVAGGGLRGKTGFFASRGDKAAHAASLGLSRALRQHATGFHTFVRRERTEVVHTEQERRNRLARRIPLPSDRLRSVLDALHAAPAHERPGLVAVAVRDTALGRELWGFAKAVGERFGKPERPGLQREGEPDLAEGLSPADRARLPYLRPLLEGGRIAAREVNQIEQQRKDLRLTQTLDLSQEQGLSPE